ncbi:hypothetical protein ABUK73_15945 [Agrobacterium sp. BA1120]|uniref:hypothetical protein n=1 Tax=Agrobacterium sp. BA1120 TaxID=3228927 RepID=UPI00336A1158
MKREFARHQFIGDSGATYTVVEYKFQIIAKGPNGTSTADGTSSFYLADGRELIEIGDDEEANQFKIFDTGEIIRRA